MNAVAVRLAYRPRLCIDMSMGGGGLERLVGESILADLVLVDDPVHDTVQHLLSVGPQLQSFVLRHPGLAVYLGSQNKSFRNQYTSINKAPH
ncbi:hypothetical protein [Amycolatopsis ultiminotia]